MDHRDDERQRESRAILKQIRQETEPQIGAHTTAWLLKTREHFSARDIDPTDRVEVLGARIGRLAGVVGFVVLLVILVMQWW